MNRDKKCKDSKPFGSTASLSATPEFPQKEVLRPHALSSSGFSIVVFSCILGLVHKRGLEPPRELPHQHLKLARLPNSATCALLVTISRTTPTKEDLRERERKKPLSHP
jgi:hypothetical protein